MNPLLLMAVLAAIAVLAALALQRFRPGEVASAGSRTFTAPQQLHRADFAGSDKPWLVAVFTSATCASCSGVWERAQVLASDEVEVQQVEVGAEPGLHERYNVEAVPTLVIADADGVVQRSFLGPTSTTHLWAAVAEARDPGSIPQNCDESEAEPPNEAETPSEAEPRR